MRSRLAALVRLFVLTTAAVALGVGQAVAGGGEVVLGAYAAPLLDPSNPGHLDILGTLDRLAEAHTTTYAYEICGPASDAEWQDLPAFLDAADDAGISVWAYLCPPSETADALRRPAYPPFGWDYPRWASALATVSSSHPALRAFCIDDFGENLPATGRERVTFSAPYTAAMVRAAHAINPRLGFWPVLYYRELVGRAAKWAAYEPWFAGVVFPFRDEPVFDTSVSRTAADQIQRVRAALPPQIRLVVMVYAARFTHQTNVGSPSPDYVHDVASSALDLATRGVDDGVMTYSLDLASDDTSMAQAESYERIKHLYRRFSDENEDRVGHG